MSAEPSTTFIVGGGIIGLLCATYLREAGQAVVLDRQGVGREASWAGGGIISPLYPSRYALPVNQLTRFGLEEYPRLARMIEQGSGIGIELQRSGLIIIDPDPNGTEADGNLSGSQAGNYTFLNSAELAEIEPQLRSATDLALYLPDAAQVRNSRLLPALRESLLKAGVRIDENQEVIGFQASAGKLNGIVTNERVFPTERCIVTAGAWSAGIVATTGLRLPVRPIRGQMLLIEAVPGLLKHIVVGGYRYLIPRRDGRILVGSTLEDVGFDKSTTPEARKTLHEFALDLVPSLAPYRIEAHWAGLRPGSPDSLPFIGEHPAIKGLYICTGHHRNGFALGPATAQMVVDMALGRPIRFDPSPFRLDRPVAEDATY